MIDTKAIKMINFKHIVGLAVGIFNTGWFTNYIHETSIVYSVNNGRSTLLYLVQNNNLNRCA